MVAELSTSARVGPEIDLLLEWVRPRAERLARETATAICEQIPDYRDRDDPSLRTEVEAHCRQVVSAFLVSATERRDPTPADFASTSRHAVLRIDRGIGLPAFLHGFRLGQIHLWDCVLEAVESDPATKDAALFLAGILMRVVETGSTTAAEAYVEAQRFDLADHARLTRDLLDDLLEGRPPTMKRRQEMLADVGLGLDTPLVVAVGSFSVPGDDTGTQADRAMLRTALNNPGRGLTVARHDEVVSVLPVDHDEDRVLARVRAAVARLGGQGIFPTVGISSVHASLLEIPSAHEEACLARRSLRGRTGVQSLTGMSTLDYLVQTHDRTARRLVPAAVRDFVAEDLAAGGTFVSTLRQYVACDLNARTTATALHVHANTVYYRLERISERTGCDVRRVESIIELLVAVGVVAGSPD